MTGDTGPLAAIKRQFPRWRAYRSDEGRFWATRTGTPPVRLPFGWAMTVDGDTPRDLREAIAEQEELPDTG